MPPRLPSRLDPPVTFALGGASAQQDADTTAAYALAARLGATGIRSGLWRTTDGRPVLGIEGSVPGRRRRWRRLDRVSSEDLPEGAGSPADVLAGGLHLFVDVGDPEAVPETIATARDLDREDHLWLGHPDRALLEAWRPLSPKVRLVEVNRLTRLGESAEARLARLARAGLDGLALPDAEWSGGLVTLAHRFERLAIAGDAAFVRILSELFDAGIDAVTSQHADRMAEAMDRFYPRSG